MDFEQMTKEELINCINLLNEDKTGKYGLIWDKEKEPEEIVKNCDKYIPVLNEIKDRNIDNGILNNILIEGDNFHSLSVLNYTHKENIDIIYIDPPYNTGNKDFMYNDKFVDIEDGYRHSKWLNFMQKRLKLSRDLLKNDGVIFVSIDDNEYAQLKLLMDKVFGENNFVGSLPRITKKAGKQHGDSVSKNHDYVLIYCKDKNLATFKGIDEVDSGFIYEDEYLSERGRYKLNQTLDYDSLWYNTAMDFAIDIDGIRYYPGGSEELHLKRHDGKHNSKDWVWRWSKSKFDFGFKNGFVVIKKGKDRPRIYTKTYLNATIEKDKSGYKVKIFKRENNISSIALVENEFSNDNAKKELSNILSQSTFDFPKPTSLIKKLCSIVDKRDCTVLDFFAGSGTTGHAILDLNSEDGGNRKFILCTNNENGICEDITYQRIKTIITGLKKDNTKYSNGVEANLRYFKTEFVKTDGTRDQLYYDLTEKCIPMLCVKEDTHVIVESNDEYSIFTDKDKIKYTCVYFDIFGTKYEEFKNKLEKIEEPKALYIFTLGDYINTDDLKKIRNYKIEPIPYRIVELYKKIVKMSRED